MALGLVVLASALAGRALSARAAGLDAALDRLAANSYSETAGAVDAIAASDAEHAAAILTALAGRQLFVAASGGGVAYKLPDGSVFDARTGAKIDALPADARAVRTNNRLRGAIETALGTLTLRAPRPERRIAAAESVFKSRDANVLTTLLAARQAESNAAVARAFDQALAAIRIGAADATPIELLAAIETLEARGDVDALALIRQSAMRNDPNVVAAAMAAVSRVEQRLALIQQAQNVWYGISLGSVLLLAAIGLAITFGVMGVINMAHGEMVMLGAYTTFAVQEAFRAWAPGAFDLSLPIAIPAAFVVAGAVGVAIERGIIRFLYGRPLETLLATFGVSMILQQAVRTTFGPTNQAVGAPSYMQGGFDVLGLAITYNRLWIVVFTAFVFLMLLVTLRYTRIGLEMRAVTQNRRMAASMGIHTARIDAMTFGLGSGIAGVAGVALSQIDNVSPNLGQSYIVDSFMVVVFGGVGNLWGTAISALTLGIANKFIEPWSGAVLAKIIILVGLILFIQKHPRGLYPLKGRTVET